MGRYTATKLYHPRELGIRSKRQGSCCRGYDQDEGSASLFVPLPFDCCVCTGRRCYWEELGFALLVISWLSKDF